MKIESNTAINVTGSSLSGYVETTYDRLVEVFGAPTFIVNNKIFWGQDRFEYALEELN